MFFPLENWWLPANWRWKMCLQKLNSHVKNCNYFFRLSDNIFHMLVLLTWEIYLESRYIYKCKFLNIYSYKNADSSFCWINETLYNIINKMWNKSWYFSLVHSSLQWFKRVLPQYYCDFMDFCCKNWKKTSKRKENWYF